MLVLKEERMEMSKPGTVQIVSVNLDAIETPTEIACVVPKYAYAMALPAPFPGSHFGFKAKKYGNGTMNSKTPGRDRRKSAH
jgi:hypothetical protein